jgi:hypothetical protein
MGVWAAGAPRAAPRVIVVVAAAELAVPGQ